jgi:hypothetical protein
MAQTAKEFSLNIILISFKNTLQVWNSVSAKRIWTPKSSHQNGNKKITITFKLTDKHRHQLQNMIEMHRDENKLADSSNFGDQYFQRVLIIRCYIYRST